jgi:homoserine kinase
MEKVAVQTAVDGVRLGAPVTARTPASSANLGPGFDSLGLALALYDEVTVVAGPPGSMAGGDVEVSVVGEGAGAVPLGEDHLVVRSLRAGLAHARVAQPAVQLRCRNAIPHGRGLGSSAAAIAVGLVLAQGLLADPDLLDDQAVYDLVATAEGHPDNASAALFGGFTIAWFDDEASERTEPGARRAGVVRLPVDPRVRAVVCVPDVELATSRARAMLPVSVPHADAAFNAGRSALLVQALTARPDLLLVATADRLHQQQRASAMPESVLLLAEVRRRGVAAVISGAGPSVLVLGNGGDPATTVAEALAGGTLGAWRVHPLAVDLLGTHRLEPGEVAPTQG